MNFVKHWGDFEPVKINILRLKNAPGESLQFNLSENLSGIEMNGQKITFVEPVEVHGEIVNKANLYTLNGVAKARVSTSCGSCLEPFEMELQAELDEAYTQAKADPDRELIGFHGDVIDIGPEVVKSLLIEMPMRLTCSPDCRGLCPRCGNNLNVKQCNCQNDVIDPRLAVLKKLQQ